LRGGISLLMMTEKRTAFRTIEGWARSVLLEGGAIRGCEKHGWMKDWADPHARERALLVALETGALDLDVVGKGELELEVAGRDAVMNEGPLFLVALAALQREDVLLDRQLDFIRLETGERDRDLEVVLVEAFDVVGGIALLAHTLGGFGEVEQAVESDGRPKQGRKIYSARSQILLGAKWLRATSGARLKWRDPDGIPIASWRRRKNL
jgi:hypothetical protein